MTTHSKITFANTSRWTVLFLTVASFFVNACTKKQDAESTSKAADEIVIGEVGSITGSEATFGISTRDGIELAVKQVNASGGLLGKKVRVIVMDNQSKADESATVMSKLITQDNVVAVLGEVASSRSLAMAPIAQNNKVPMITPSSTNSKVTQVGDHIFRVCFIDEFQGLVMAKFARQSLKLKRVAILREVSSDYSVGLSNVFAEQFKQMGGEIVVDQSYATKDVDFKSQLTAIKTKNPEAIFVPGYYSEVGLIARQAKELQINVPLLGGDGWDSEKLTQIAGKNINGSYFSNHYSPDDTSPQVQKFISEYKAMYNEIPSGLAAMGYDAALVLFDAIKRAGSLERAAIRKALAETTQFSAVTGVITMDKNRDASKPAVIIEIKDGKFTYKETIKPT